VALNTPPPSPNPSVASFSALPIGTKLQEYEITGVLGEGGFGIVYLAHDKQLDREIAIKEYMPASLASRGANGAVVVRSGHHGATFQAGRQSFITEAKLLAKFKHAALVEIFRFWEQNGTAYMAMPFYRGQTLKQYLRDKSYVVDERWLRAFLAPLLDALEHLHEIHCYHRDISPDNILILDNGQPLLLDFGAARRIIGDLTQALTVILKPGYAPVEQYADDSTIKQGPWTDIYGMAAVCFFAIRRAAPPAAVTRMMRDPMVPLETQGQEGFSKAFLAAIDGALKVKPEDRPQSVQAFREMLGLSTYHADARQSLQDVSNLDPQDNSVDHGVNTHVLSERLAHEERRAAALSPIEQVNSITARTPAEINEDAPTLILSHHEPQPTFTTPTPTRSPVPTPVPIPTQTPAAPAQVVPKPTESVRSVATQKAAIEISAISSVEKAKIGTIQMPSAVKTQADAAVSTPAIPIENNPPVVRPSAGVKDPLSTKMMAVIGAITAAILFVAIWLFNAGGGGESKSETSEAGVAVKQVAKQPAAVVPSPQANETMVAPIAPVLDIAKQVETAPVTAQEIKTPTVLPVPETKIPPVAETPQLFGPEIDKATEERLRIEKENSDRLAATIGFVKLDVQPWGNIVVNGTRRAISPPTKRLSLPAGEYKIEISNPGFPSYFATINVVAKETAVVVYRFQ
jgi:non-specific serine/threonine protein kinase